MSLQVSFQIVGWLIIGLCCFYILTLIAGKFIENVIRCYFASKITYTRVLEGTSSSDGFKDLVAAMVKKRGEKLVEKDL